MGKKSGNAPREDPAPTAIDPARREELRLKLRNKMRNGGGSQQETAAQLLRDPASALLRMGVDDADVLRAAPGMVKSIAARVRSGKPVTGERGLKDTLEEACAAITKEGPQAPEPEGADDDSDDEEAPPPSLAA